MKKISFLYNNYLLRLLILSCFICNLCSDKIFAQDKPIDTVSTEGKFQLARYYAYNKEHDRAKQICKELMLMDEPDAAVLLGRVYSWDGMYDSSITVLKEIMVKRPGYYDAIDALIDVYYWSDKYYETNTTCDEALHYHPNTAAFIIKKAKAVNALKRKSEAIALLDTLLEKEPENIEAKNLLHSIKTTDMLNKVSVGYYYDYFRFNTLDPQQMVSMQYSRVTPSGSVVARINYANRFLSNGVQYELDAYPSLGKKWYAYTNVGYSKAGFFPIFRCGGEVYRGFPKGFEASAGFRYLDFATSTVTIYTAYLGRYLGNYWLSLRTFLTPGNGTVSRSVVILARKYYADADTYIGLRVGYGLSPDDRRKLVDATTINLESLSGRIEINKKFKDLWIGSCYAAYENQEFYPGLFREIFSFNVGIARSF